MKTENGYKYSTFSTHGERFVYLFRERKVFLQSTDGDNTFIADACRIFIDS